MANVLPASREAMIQWFIQRIAAWNAAPTSIGLTAAQVAAFATLLSGAETDQNSAFGARITSRSATVTYYASSDAVRSMGADLIKTIKAYAETTGDPGVYAAADVPPPSPPAPLGPPQTPKNLSATLNTAGEIGLAWTASRAGGTSFTVERSTAGGVGPWAIIGTSEEAAFTDTAVPRGFDSVSYRVTAARSGGSSTPTAAVAVLFGNTDGAGETGTGLGIAA